MAGTYGILHDQVTASISQEYYTRFKFIQFNLNPDVPFRTGVSIIGFYATWWTGGLIGLVLGLISFLLYPDRRTMRKAISRALLIVVATALLFSAGGYFYGNFYLSSHGVSWWMPDGLNDKTGYIITGSMHNSSYAGGLCGLLLAVIYLLRNSPKLRAHNHQNRYSKPSGQALPSRLHQTTEA